VIFRAIYEKTLRWAQHRHAVYYLGFISFIESVFFPIPADVMLAPMTLANRERAWFYALLTTVTSVAGGIVGYLLGLWAFDPLVKPVLEWAGKMETYHSVVNLFDSWGIWFIFLAGFTPLPYKVFTISAGALAMAFWPFVISSFFGRAGRFFLVAGLVRWGGERLEATLNTYIERIGWGTVLLFAAYLTYKGIH
tara:strand:+ start:8785 stop:9366 length:582 start_codon:yes stop_codon:yes gene_type:complete